MERREKPVVPAPEPKRGRGRPPKERPPIQAQPTPEPPKPSAIKEAIDKGLPWFREHDVLSEKEAEALYEPLKAALADYFDYADAYIWHREQHSRADEPIWSNADDDDLNAMVRLMLKRGKRSPAAATVARAIVNSDDYVTTAVFFLPRMVETRQRLRAAPKREKRKRA